MSPPPENDSWERHWHSMSERPSVLGGLASVVRRHILSRAVRHYADRYFGAEGFFVECGCGTGQSSARIRRERRRLVALDFSARALRQARQTAAFTDHLQADIRCLPFRDGSVAGIWNLGVMEHFDPASTAAILGEFHRVLRPGAAAILFWPPEFGSSRWVLAPIEWVLSLAGGRPVRAFPDEVNRLRSRGHAEQALQAAGLVPAAIDFTARDAFIHMVVVARKPAP